MRRIRAQTKPEDLDILEIHVNDLDDTGENTREFPGWFIQLFVRGVLKKVPDASGMVVIERWRFNGRHVMGNVFLVHNLKTRITEMVMEEAFIYSEYTIIPPSATCIKDK